MAIKFTTRIHNKGDKEIGLQVEPLGEHYRIAPGTYVDMIVQGPAPGDPAGRPIDAGLFDVDHEPDCITIYAWVGAEIEVIGAQMGP